MSHASCTPAEGDSARDARAASDACPRVLVLSRSYPNSQFPTLGLWVRRLVRAASRDADMAVVSPVPYAPPIPFTDAFDRYRKVERRRTGQDGIPVEYPRVPAGPGYLLHPLEAALQYLPVRGTVDRLHERRPFDLIHAHFIYPEGVVAAGLGRRYGIPVVTTEHSLWRPWLDEYGSVRRQVLWALDHIRTVTVVSEAVRDSVEAIAGGDGPETRLLPNVLDDQIFTPPAGDAGRVEGRILFVGAVRRVKGLDVAVRALDRLIAERPAVHLRVVGEPFRRSYEEDEREVRELIAELGLSDRVTFVGGLPPEGVADEMRSAQVLVVPSRRESFSSVTVEALACGTPVVATRCGGPEEILDEETGMLVPPEDPEAFAEGVDLVLSGGRRFKSNTMRQSMLNRYDRSAARERLALLYRDVVRSN